MITIPVNSEDVPQLLNWKLHEERELTFKCKLIIKYTEEQKNSKRVKAQLELNILK